MKDNNDNNKLEYDAGCLAYGPLLHAFTSVGFASY